MSFLVKRTVSVSENSPIANPSLATLLLREFEIKTVLASVIGVAKSSLLVELPLVMEALPR